MQPRLVNVRACLSPDRPGHRFQRAVRAVGAVALLPVVAAERHPTEVINRQSASSVGPYCYVARVPRYRLMPTPSQEAMLREHCAHARFVWNLGNEQRLMWRRERGPTPGFAGQCRQLTEARTSEPWLRAGSIRIQQQALRDLDRAWRYFFAGTHKRPSWRKIGQHEGFGVAGPSDGRDAAWGFRRVSRSTGEVRIPKIGWVRFRWSRAVPEGVKSYRVTMGSSGRWHIVFPAIPTPIAGPGTGEAVGIDRGVTVSAALSTGERLLAPRLTAGRRRRQLNLQRKLARAKRGSNRRTQVKLSIARLDACDADARKDWAEKLSTDLARRFDVIRVEDLKIQNMTRSARGTAAKPGRNVRQKAGLNRGILASGWGILVKRLEQKATGRVEKINPRFTSRRCSACGHTSPDNRKSQAVFRCVACAFTLNADVNAAINIAAGHAVTARGDLVQLGRSVNREPQIAA